MSTTEVFTSTDDDFPVDDFEEERVPTHATEEELESLHEATHYAHFQDVFSFLVLFGALVFVRHGLHHALRQFGA